jgi:molybdopterin/thiamine biosynthesis adenylyltransferase
MAHLIQVGAGSGGMPVLDMLCRDPAVTQVTLIEPDIYKPHNVERHVFGAEGIGEPKAELASAWLKARRPDLPVEVIVADILAADVQSRLQSAIAEADIGVCAADNEPAKYHWDALMRRHGKPWTLGEVLSGGIGGFVHWFTPNGPCYGCVASFLQRSIATDTAKPPDYSQPGGAVVETTIPASRASINAIASLHALITLDLLHDARGYEPGFTSLLFTLRRVAGVFDESFRPYRFQIPKAADCFICRAGRESEYASPEDLDVALDQALERLGNA